VEKQVFDLNVLAVNLVQGHRGFEFVSQVVEEDLRGVYIRLILDFFAYACLLDNDSAVESSSKRLRSIN
jgi:hypothetical protein